MSIKEASKQPGKVTVSSEVSFWVAVRNDLAPRAEYSPLSLDWDYFVLFMYLTFKVTESKSLPSYVSNNQSMQCFVFIYHISVRAGFISISQPPKWEKVIQVLSSHCRFYSSLSIRVFRRWHWLFRSISVWFQAWLWKRKSSCRMTWEQVIGIMTILCSSWTSQWLLIPLTAIFS